MTQPATTQYTHDSDAITTPAVAPLSTVPLESMAAAAPAENDVIVVSRKRVRIVTLACFGAGGVMALGWSIACSLEFVVGASDIGCALNALGIVASAGFVGACAGSVGMWARMEAGR